MVVSPSAPRTEQGLYWGYSVRLAPSFGAVFTQSPYEEGYDISIGTSERGSSVDDLELPNFRYSTKNVTLASTSIQINSTKLSHSCGAKF